MIKPIILLRKTNCIVGNSDDVAYGALFLSSEEARYITGHTIHINGGMLMV